MSNIFRIHPAINFARVGNSEEYYIAPETAAGVPINGGPTTGGLPIKPGTEADTITSSDVRDAQGAFKRQAARFRVFLYEQEGAEAYPNGGGTEVQIGSTVGGKTVTDIVWTVHLANKKANCYVLENPNLGEFDLTIAGYENGKLPPLRNASFSSGDPNDPVRRRALIIDPGPRAIKGASAAPVKFDHGTVASHADAGTGSILPISNYPKSYPSQTFPQLFCPSGPIDTLGELRTDAQGRLLVLGGYGRACALEPHGGQPDPLGDDVDNDGWFDDTSDGPVTAVIVFNDNTTTQAAGAWVIATDPGYAPQTLNVVSLWDEFFDTWVRNLALVPGLFANGAYNTGYQPSFDDQVHPIFRAAAMQQWNTNLPSRAINGHKMADGITAASDPSKFKMIFNIIRKPGDGDNANTPTKMPLALGDTGRAFLYPTETQYFFLTQWTNGNATSAPVPALGPGELLDKTVLVNCLGGRFSPGIDMTFIVRQPELYITAWQTSGTGPFRLNPAPLDYGNVNQTVPLLTTGYVPIHSGASGLEPGDASKFMAIPWHTDYNSCGTHPIDPNTPNSKTLYWSWPAQRPYAVYVATDVTGTTLPPQRYSVRGAGTENPDSAQQGRYQDRLDMVRNWSKIGVILQGTNIDGGTFDPNVYLEVASLLDDSGDTVVPWPNFAKTLNAADAVLTGGSHDRV